jgi:8-oxo-dGTP pyrophosphatase MutT (NUDIX family)
MAQINPERKTVFDSPWFQVLESAVAGQKFPNYAIAALDFVGIIAVTERNELLLVRQFRHAVGAFTLELPAGHVEKGETPEQAARKELIEETGHAADTFELIASLSPSPARFTNRMWCYFAVNARRAPDAQLEAGMHCVPHTGGVAALLREPDFYSSGNWAALLAAVAQGKLTL